MEPNHARFVQSGRHVNISSTFMPAFLWGPGASHVWSSPFSEDFSYLNLCYLQCGLTMTRHLLSTSKRKIGILGYLNSKE